jgi:hypothetical protein
MKNQFKEPSAIMSVNELIEWFEKNPEGKIKFPKSYERAMSIKHDSEVKQSNEQFEITLPEGFKIKISKKLIKELAPMLLEFLDNAVKSRIQKENNENNK